MDKLALSHQSASFPLCLFALLFCPLTLAGCASLPRFEEVYQRLDTEKENPPEIIGPYGQLSPKMSTAVMDRNDKTNFFHILPFAERLGQEVDKNKAPHTVKIANLGESFAPPNSSKHRRSEH